MSARRQRGKARFQKFHRREQVGNQDEQAALASDFGGAFERRDQVGGRARGSFLQREHELAQVAGAIARGKIVTNGIIECQRADGIALLEQKIAERRCERVRVITLGVAQRAVAHRLTTIDEELAAQVRLVFKLLDVVAIAARVELPIDVTWIVTGRVLAIFCKLDGEAMIRTAMKAIPKALHHDARAEF